jgi:3-deoxy-D-manno-octulosonic-acid transferase
MPYLLDAVYLFALVAASPWLVWKAISTGKYREGLAARLLGRVPVRSGARTCVWLHAVSMGEVNLLAPLIEELARRRPDWECVVSTTTRTGYALARRKYAHLKVFYSPLDFSWAVRAAMRRIRPDLLVLAELELWPNLIRAARRHGARVAIVNGRLSERSFRGYARVRPVIAGVLAEVELIAVQDEVYAERFRRLGALPERVQVTGSMKYDGARTDREDPATLRLARLAGFAADDAVFVAGSTQAPEEEVALAVFRHLADKHPRLRLVVVPRHPERFEAVARLLAASGMPWQRRTALELEGANPQARVLLVDAVGELGAWWGTARIAFVGGSLGDRGGQNMIEPAAYGAAISFGPNTRNFRDVVERMLARQAAVVVHDPDELAAFVERCLIEPSYATALGQRACALVAEQLGAVHRTAERLTDLCDGARETAVERRPAA